MDGKIKISVITVTFNAASDISNTVYSVLRQTFKDFEYVIMDGNSSDATLDIIKRYNDSRIRLFSETDNGIYDAMNKALDRVTGSYVLFINAGDRLADNEVLEKYYKAIIKYPNSDIIYGQTNLIDFNGNIVGKRHLTAPKKLDFNSFKNGMMVCHQAFMVKKDIAPYYNLKYKFSADYEWCLKCLQISNSNVYLGDDAVIHYLNEGITTSNHKQSLKERFKIMCQYYGTVPTLFRHIKFGLRFLLRKLLYNSHQ